MTPDRYPVAASEPRYVENVQGVGMIESRVYPLLEVQPRDLADLTGDELASFEPVHGGLTNTIHRVVLQGGATVAVKHFAGGARAYEDELAALRSLAGILPVPAVVRADPDHHAIVYRWIDGVPLDECRRHQSPAAFASLAEPLGRLLAWLSQTEARSGGWDIAAILAQTRRLLERGRPRDRLGPFRADALLRALDHAGDRLVWGAACLSHGDLCGRNILVRRADGDRWRIGGVIDWESAAGNSPLVDLGSLFRQANRYDEQFIASFERGYVEAGGVLPEDWLRTARLVDATLIVEMLDEDRELPGVFAECRTTIAKLVADLAT